jgi:hypothetical protein
MRRWTTPEAMSALSRGEALAWVESCGRPGARPSVTDDARSTGTAGCRRQSSAARITALLRGDRPHAAELMIREHHHALAPPR